MLNILEYIDNINKNIVENTYYFIKKHDKVIPI